MAGGIVGQQKVPELGNNPHKYTYPACTRDYTVSNNTSVLRMYCHATYPKPQLGWKW